MEEEKLEDIIKDHSSPPVPPGLPINWGLITGPVPEPVFPGLSLVPTVPPPLESTYVHSLQTKVKSHTHRWTRGRERERDRGTLDTEVLSSSTTGQISSKALLSHRPVGEVQVCLPTSPRQSGPVTNSNSSDEEKEVQVQVRLEIHSPPAEVQGELAFQEVRGNGEEASVTNDSHICCYSEPGTSPQTHLSENLSKVEQASLPPPPVLSCSSTLSPGTPPSTSHTTTRHWAPPKGFWRVARPETLLLNGVDPFALPVNSYTETQVLDELQMKTEEAGSSTPRSVMSETEPSLEFGSLESMENTSDKLEPKEMELTDPNKGLCSDSSDSSSLQGDRHSADEKLMVKQRAYAKLRERQQKSKKGRDLTDAESSAHYGDTPPRGDYELTGPQQIVTKSDTAILQELEPYLRSLLVISDDLPLSPRHEQAKRLLERARLKAQSNHVKGDRLLRRSHPDQSIEKKSIEPHNQTSLQTFVQAKDTAIAHTVSGPFLLPNQRDTSPGDKAGRSRWYGCSPTRVRFEDESEKEAESRYLDRVRQRGRPAVPKSKSKDSNTDSSSSGSERSRSHKSVSMLPSQKQDDCVGVSGETTTVIREIIVIVKKCEACGSVAREPQAVSSMSDPQSAIPQKTVIPEDPRGKSVPCWVPPNKPEISTRPKPPLTVTFAGAYVLGENKECSMGWKSSGFGKLRRRSRKGESRLESGHGPYGPSWAQRRNSNPRNRVNLSRAVSFAPDSPITLEPRLLETSGGFKESPTPALPIKSALKSSSRNRSAAGQSTVQFHITASQGSEGGCQHSGLLDTQEARREASVSVNQGTPATSSSLPCIRPSTLRYSQARLTADLPAAEVWDPSPDGRLSGDTGPVPEFHPALRNMALSRAEDLRAELLRAEHLKAEASWEENSDGSRKLDGRPKLFLRRFFSSIGLNSVGRLVKGGRSSSMEQLSIPTSSRASTASPSPTRRPQPTIRIQRTPSLQTLHTVLPLAQLRKASSVQSLERRTERATILGEVQIPYGLAPSPDSPQLELHRTLSVEDILASRMVRPVSRVAQVFSDGSLLLELIRPPKGPFGFVISRGKGRPDTGVYVEKVGDGSGEGPFVGLLGVGDEILQVNGEAVAGLSLDQVTRLMTRESIASLRIMPARRSQR